MGKNRKNKSKNKKSPASHGAGDQYSPVRFNLEENADELFLEAFENLKSNSVVDKDFHSGDAKSTQGKNRAESKSAIAIDLHGCTLAEAQLKIESTILQLLATPGKSHNIRIVTGKGIHSAGSSGVLAAEIHGYVWSRFGKYITKIQESPHVVKVGGVPIRGHFDLTLLT